MTREPIIDLAHELWAMAQGNPIEEAVAVMETRLQEHYAQVEPVAWVYENKGGAPVLHHENKSDRFLADKHASELWPDVHRITPLYTAPPAPAVAPAGYIERLESAIAAAPKLPAQSTADDPPAMDAPQVEPDACGDDLTAPELRAGIALQLREIERLRAQNNALRGEVAGMKRYRLEEAERAEATIAELRAQVEALQRLIEVHTTYHGPSAKNEAWNMASEALRRDELQRKAP